MLCPYCHSANHVVYGYPGVTDAGIPCYYRRRECADCGEDLRATTVEHYLSVDPIRLKRLKPKPSNYTGIGHLFDPEDYRLNRSSS